MKNTQPDEKVWQFIHQCADIHSYRSDYAVAIYKAHARKISEIPFDRVNKGTGKRYQSDVYTCRKDEAGKKLERSWKEAGQGCYADLQQGAGAQQN